jgi:hypothetical protein
MKNKKNIYILLAIAIILFQCNRSEKRIIEEMNICIKQNKDLVFQNIQADFDSLLIIQPYTSVKKLKSEMGIDLNRTGIDGRDDVFLIVFIKKREVINIVYIDRNKYDSKIDSYKIFPKDYKFKLIPKSGSVFISE